MIIRLFDNMDQCSETEVARLLTIASEQRKTTALQYKHLLGRYTCLKSYELLISILRETGTINANERPLFSIGQHGKPSLVGYPDIHFNISHCKQAIGIVVDHRPVGIDVERIVLPKESMVSYSMTQQECETIRSAKDSAVAFTQLWTQKEALLKMRGTGLQGGLKEALLSIHNGISLQTHVEQEKGYVWSIAHQQS